MKLYVVPLAFADKEMSYKEHFVVEKSWLGHVEVEGDVKTSVNAKLFGKDQRILIELQVWKSNTRDDNFHPVNIQQERETQAFFGYHDTVEEGD